MSKREHNHKTERVDDALVKPLRQEIMPFTERSLYENSHFLNVERHIKALASQRKLDVNTALCIAYLHDISRIKEGVNGKIHSKRSAEIAKAWLKKCPKGSVSGQVQKRICSAILHHNQKSKIHGPFDELIKDADSLAHQDEFGLSIDNDFEQMRLDLMRLDEVHFAISEESSIKSIYSRYSAHFIALLSTTPNEMNHWVHELRITVRKLRALLFFADDKTLRNETIIALKPIFKVLSKSRELYVLYRSLDGFEPLMNISSALSGALDEENDRLQKHIERHYTSDYIKGLTYLLAGNETHLSLKMPVLQKSIRRYVKRLNLTMLNDIDTLHQLRIEGKTLKYIMGSDLVKMTDPVFQETLLTLHELLGDLNDIRDKKQFFKHYELSFDERQFLMEQMKSQTRFLKHEIKKRLFLLKKLMSLNKIIL